MKRAASGLIKLLLTLAVAWVVLSAIVVGIARELVYQIDDFQPQLVDYFNQKTPFELELESITGSWKGLTPKLQLYNLTLRSDSATGPGLSALSVNLEILLLDSLFSLAPRIRLHLHGAEGKLHYRNGGIEIEGIQLPSTKEQTTTDDDGLDLLLAQRKLLITDSKAEVSGLYDQPINVNLKKLQFESGNRRRYLTGDVVANGPSQLVLHLKGKLSGTLFKKGTANGEIYAKIDEGDWLPWLPPEKRTLSQATLTSLRGAGEFWFNLDQGVVRDFVSSFSIQNIGMETTNKVKPPFVEHLTGQARWLKPVPGEWKLTLQNLDMETSDFIWRPEFLHLHSKPAVDGAEEITVFADNIKISPWINYFLAIGKNEGKLFKLIKKTRPAGSIRNLVLELTLQEQKVQDYRFALELAKVKNRSFGFVPGFHGLDIQLWGKKDLFLFQLQEEYMELSYPRLFRDQLTLNHLRASAKLQLSDEGIILQSDAIQAATEDAQAVTQFSLTLPKQKEEHPFLQLQATLRNADGKQTSKYLPAGILPEGLLHWLDTAIIDGHLLRGDILVHGPAKFHLPEPLAVVLGFTAQDAVLQFQPDWEEPVKNGVADVVVDRTEVIAEVITANYYDQTLKQGMVYAPYLTDLIRPEVNVKAQTSGQADTGINVLKQTPLADLLGGFIQDLDAKGELGVDLNIKVPLDRASKVELQADADIDVKNGWLRINSQNLELDNLEGKVQFGLTKGLVAEQITGKVLNGPFNGRIETKSLEDAKEIIVSVNGSAALEQVQKWQPLSVLKLLSGDVNYQFGLHIPLNFSDPNVRQYFDLTSDMVGAELALPAPFDKTKESEVPFYFKLTLDEKPTLLNLSYGDSFAMAMQTHEGKLQKGHVLFGASEAPLPEVDALVISGVLSEFDDQLWRPALDQLAKESKKNNEPVDNDIPYLVDSSDLHIKKLTLAGIELGATDVSVRAKQNAWLLAVNNSMVRGNATLPHYLLNQDVAYSQQTEPVVLDVEYLNIPKSEQVDSDTEWQAMDLSPLSFPPLEITLAQFNYGNAKFGHWNIQADPTSNGLNVSQLNAAMNGVTVKGGGSWLEREDGSRYSQIKVNASAKNAADAMKVWGVPPSLTSKKATANANLNWPGAPTEFSLLRTKGNLDVELSDGTFINVSSNAAGKLWGALNFETVMRRLKLNFDDLRESEMVYDDIKGRFGLNSGILKIQDVALNSPSIKLRADGDVDLKQEQLDVNLDVTVPVTRNLILPAAVIGGVPIAATIYVVEKVLGDQFDKLTTIKYAVSGGFENPKYEVKDSFSIIPKQVGEAVMSNGNDSTPEGNAK